MGREKDEVTVFSENMKKVITLNGGTINIHNDYIEVFDIQKTVFIDNRGNVKTARELFESNKLYGIEKQGKWGFEDRNGNVVVPCKYDLITEFNEAGFAGIKENEKWGIIDQNGNIVCECIYLFGNSTKPEVLGKYYKTYKENNEMYFADEVTDEIYENGL